MDRILGGEIKYNIGLYYKQIHTTTDGDTQCLLISALTPDDGVDIAPGTNKATIIKLLYTNPTLGYKPSEIRESTDIPRGSVTTTLLRLHDDGHIGKTTDGYYHALESRDDLRRFATGLVQVNHLTDRYADDLSPENVEQTKSRTEQLDDATENHTTDIDAELDAVEDDLE